MTTMPSPSSDAPFRFAPLSAHQILLAWETGRRQHPVDRVLALLAIANPGDTPEAIVSLTVGERDRRLIGLRRATFGDRLPSHATCPECAEPLGFTLRVDDVLVNSGDVSAAETARHELNADGYNVTFRIPDSQDLTKAAAADNVAEARSILLERCLTNARHNGTDVPAIDLPESVIARVADEIATADPQAEVLIDLACPACDSSWQLQFDIAAYLWTEISRRARRLLEEVHVLATAYGWSEAEILSMTASRRRLYREFLDA